MIGDLHARVRLARAYEVPGYFAADGDAANTSATSGNKWRAHLSPDKTGRWNWRIVLRHRGTGVALATARRARRSRRWTDGPARLRSPRLNKTAPDFRARGRLQYVGRALSAICGQRRVLPEARLAIRPRRCWPMPTSTGQSRASRRYRSTPTRRTCRTGRPATRRGKTQRQSAHRCRSTTWRRRGVNAMSFLPYNAGGDGDNVWPFVDRDDKLHYDVSKLDQWQIVFDHAQQKGIYLHFKLQENEIDDNVRGNPGEAARRGPGPGRYGTGKRVSGWRRSRAGAEALHTRAGRAIWLRARAELECRRRKHAVERAAARDGHQSQGHRSVRGPPHRRPYVPEQTGSHLSCVARPPIAVYRRFAADGLECGPRANAAVAPRFRAGEQTVGCGERRAGARQVLAYRRTPAIAILPERMRRAATLVTHFTTFARTCCGGI